MKILSALLVVTVVVSTSPAHAGEIERLDGSFRQLPDGLLDVRFASAADATKEDVDLQTPSQVDDAIMDLEAQRRKTGLGGPIATTTVGGVLAIAGVAMIAAAVSTCNYYNSYPYTGCDEEEKNGWVTGGAVATGVGAALVIAGTAWIIKRKGKRRDIDAEILDLKRRKRSLGDSVGLGLDLREGRQGFMMRLTF